MLRRAQHKRKFINVFAAHSVRSELRRRVNGEFFNSLFRPDLATDLRFTASSRVAASQVEAGAILGIKQPHFSALMRNRSGNFSVERLVDFLIALGQDVEITVRPTRKEHGQLSIVLA